MQLSTNQTVLGCTPKPSKFPAPVYSQSILAKIASRSIGLPLLDQKGIVHEEGSQRFAQCYVGDVVMSAITLAKLEFGVSVCADPERERKNLDALIELIEVKSFDVSSARSYGPVRKATRERKSDYLDKLIAACACDCAGSDTCDE